MSSKIVSWDITTQSRGAQHICASIINQAIKDWNRLQYKAFHQRCWRLPVERYMSTHEISDLIGFFFSDWFIELCDGAEFDSRVFFDNVYISPWNFPAVLSYLEGMMDNGTMD